MPKLKMEFGPLSDSCPHCGGHVDADGFSLGSEAAPEDEEGPDEEKPTPLDDEVRRGLFVEALKGKTP